MKKIFLATLVALLLTACNDKIKHPTNDRNLTNEEILLILEY